METENQRTPVVSPATKTNWWKIISFFLLIIIIVVISVFLTYIYVSSKYNRPENFPTTLPVQNTPSITNYPTSVLPKPTIHPITESTQYFPSTDESYLFYITPGSKTSPYKCYFGIVKASDKTNTYLTEILINLLNSETLPCTEGAITFNQESFKGWIDENRFIVNDLKGKMLVIDATKSAITFSYTYNSNYFFSLVSNDLKNWLFRKDANNSSYVLLDNSGKIIRDNINFTDYSLFIPLYDNVNNGVVFVSRKDTTLTPTSDSPYGTAISYRFDFLSFTDNSFRTLLTTNFTPVAGHGCGVNKLKSIVGEVIIQSDCIIVDKQYLQQDKYIHIKL